jgi:DNA processing protein
VLEALAMNPIPNESLALHWLALALTPRLGPTRARRLVEHFGGVQNIFKASLTELEATGIQTVSAQSLGTGQSMELAHDELGRVAAAGVSVVCLDDCTYPAQLKQIYDPPLVLYVRGNVDAITQPGIAVVGTRHPTPCGLGMAERLACDLANRGLVIFSGLARGVDAAAHRGAINAKGKTVAVFGTGVEIIYPKENTRLTEQMLALGGCPDLRISYEHIRRAAKLSHSQSHHQWNFDRRTRRGSRGIQRHQDYIALRSGAESRSLRRSRQCH